ncbi:MAG: stage II sporulation protein M [Bacillota bacterium]|nr:stage II sporulation protein M [Bacillota bacterium]
MENNKRSYSENLSFKDYLDQIRPHVLIIALAFIIIGLIAFLVTIYDLGGLGTFLKEGLEGVMENLGQLIGEDGQINVIGLILNNVRVAALAFVIGIVPFLYLPAFILLVNALIVGGFLGLAGMESLMNALIIFVFGIMPHGVFELTAIFFGLAAGFNLSSAVNKTIRRKNPRLSINQAFANGIKTLVFVSIPLLVLAGFIEAFLTPRLLSLFI